MIDSRWNRTAGLLVTGLSAIAMLLNAVSAVAQDDPGLQPGFTPPRPAPAVFSEEKPLIKAAEIEEWRKNDRINFQTALEQKQLDDSTRRTLGRGIEVMVYQLSLPDERNNLTDLGRTLVRYVDQSRGGDAVKGFVLSEIVKRAQDLLSGNFHVRCHAVLLIGALNVSPEVPGTRVKPAVAYVNAVPVLLDVITPPQGATDQPEAVRILAALNITRMLQEGRQTLPANSRLPADCARRILSEMARPVSDWYQVRLMEALVETGLATVPDQNNVQKPEIVETLARMMADRNRPYRVRCHAAYMLGKAAMPSGIQGAPIAYAATQLAQQMAVDLNQGQMQSVHALFRFQDLYRAFRGEPNVMTADGRSKSGLINSLGQQPVTAAESDIRPIFAKLLSEFQGGATNPRVVLAAPLIQKLQTWQAPATMTLVPNGQPVNVPFGAAPATNAPAEAPAAGNTAAPAGPQAGDAPVVNGRAG